MIERRITLGCIFSEEYLKQIKSIWDISLIESVAAKKICSWAWIHYDRYNKPIGNEVMSVFIERSKTMSKTDLRDMEELLSDLNVENEQEPVNLEYLLTSTQEYFKERRLSLFSDQIKGLLSKGSINDAEKLACEFKPFPNDSEASLSFDNDMVFDRIEKAFAETNVPVVYFPNQLGTFWNSQFVKGGLVALLASEKRGKTFMLLDIALRGVKNKKKVVFFQAGDMTESQQLKRICVYLTQKSDQKRYCGTMFQPVRDCIYNQCDDCLREERVVTDGLWGKEKLYTIRKEKTLEMLIEAYNENPDYVPCHHCEEYETKPWGTPWIEKVDVGENPLTVEEAQDAVEDFFIKQKKQFKLSSHANGTLSVKQIRALLAVWEKQDGFVPDLIVVDYADLLVPENKDFRHGQNEIWKDLRRLSQEKGQPLVVTATQADSKSYDSNRLKLSNFSEDKRKYAHCTAFYGLNQDTQGEEKKIGLLRINELIIREGDFSVSNEITILQNLRRGRPFLASYF